VVVLGREITKLGISGLMSSRQVRRSPASRGPIVQQRRVGLCGSGSRNSSPARDDSYAKPPPISFASKSGAGPRGTIPLGLEWQLLPYSDA